MVKVDLVEVKDGIFGWYTHLNQIAKFQEDDDQKSLLKLLAISA